jgi:hypothetical protein
MAQAVQGIKGNEVGLEIVKQRRDPHAVIVLIVT